jgi:hypothetical protein
MGLLLLQATTELPEEAFTDVEKSCDTDARQI